jgi:hypothetical protein
MGKYIARPSPQYERTLKNNWRRKDKVRRKEGKRKKKNKRYLSVTV